MSTDESPVGNPTGKRWQTGVLLVLASGLFFALTSPFNAVTYLPVLGRWVYWCGLIAITAVTHLAIGRVAGQSWSRWALALVVSIAATPLVLMAILVVQQALQRPVPTHFWPSLSASVWVINAALAALAAYLTREAGIDPSSDKPESPQQPDPATGLRRRLPEHLRQQPIWALNAQDHYLNVVLADGQHLVHMRFGDAVMLLAGHDGLTVHRSWWVAREAVEKINRQGRRVDIALKNGQEVPVSRAGASRLREAGWLD